MASQLRFKFILPFSPTEPDPAVAYRRFEDPDEANRWGAAQEKRHAFRDEYQRKALLSYKRQGFRGINAFLRNDKSGKWAAFVAQCEDGFPTPTGYFESIDDDIMAMLDAFEESVIDAGVVAWRAFNDEKTAALLQSPPGGYFLEKAFVSTSLVLPAVQRFLNPQVPGGVLMKILVPMFSNAIYLEQIYEDEPEPCKEFELLLPRRSTFKVLGHSVDEEGITHALVEYLPAGSGFSPTGI